MDFFGFPQDSLYLGSCLSQRPENLAVDSSNVWKYLVFYDPTLKNVFIWCFFSSYQGVPQDSLYLGWCLSQRPENLAVDSSNVWKYLVFYNPTLKIVFLWLFFVFQGVPQHSPYLGCCLSQRPENLAVDSSNVWKYLVFYDPTLKIDFLWLFGVL